MKMAGVTIFAHPPVEAMSDEQTSFKVTDRRLFNPDGTPREIPEEERALPEKEATVTEPPPAERVVEQKAQPEPQASPDQAASAAEEEEELPDAHDPASFANFIMSIASNAASALGMMEHPVTHKREVDLELGKHWIDVLGMLQKKTHGNLASQESQILESLLSDLRMQFVSLRNSTGGKSQSAYTGRDILGG
jgi:hypothetical protein